MSDSLAISVEALVKRFGETVALDGLDLEVHPGKILGLLGPNGAGKTTAVRILTTLLRPDGGSASVMGLDVVRDAARLREIIGLTGQYAAVDEILTGRENLVMVGRLCRMPKSKAQARADELLERFDLADAGGRLVKTYSGGMRRRLDLAASLVADPKVLFLDEPTTGLDPRSRLAVWQMIRELSGSGTTILLTTQYLEEADQLADDIVVIDHGKSIASGTPEQMKRMIGGERIEATVSVDDSIEKAAQVLGEVTSDEEVVIDEGRRSISIGVTGGFSALADAVRRFEGAGIELEDLALRRPTLDEVFLKLTGHAADEGEEVEAAT